MLNKLIRPSLVLSGLFIFLLLTDPQKIPLVLLLIPFFAIALVTFMLARYFQYLARKNDSKPGTMVPLLVTFELVTILILSSLHQLSWKDIVLAGLFGFVFVWYAKRARL